VSDKTFVSFLFEDSYIVKQTYVPQYEQETYLSEIYHTTDGENNFYATVFYNLENLLKDKLYFRNIINYPEFITYLRDNFLVNIKASLIKGENTLVLDTQIQRDVFLDNTARNDSFIMNSVNIDIVKYDGGFIELEIGYNESSVAYIQNVIVPFIDQLKQTLQAGVISNNIIDLLMFYKLIKEFSSEPNSLTELISFRFANSTLPINENNVERIKQIVSYTKSMFVKTISNVTAENIANTKIILQPKQQINLYNNNAGIDFINLPSITENTVVYAANSFRQTFEQEVSRFFPNNSIVANGVSFDINSLPVSFAPRTIRLSNQEQFTNETNFSSYLTTQITDEEKTNGSANFAKIISFFELNRDIFKVNSYNFADLLSKDLNYKNLAFVEIPREKTVASSTPSTFSVVQRDNVISYNSFPPSLTNEACLDIKPSEQASKDLTNNIRNAEIPENLFNNLASNSTFVRSNLYADNYANVSLAVQNPVQVLYPYNQFLERTNTLFQETEPVVADSKLFSLFYTNFRIIGKIEYLSLLNDGMYSIWRTLNLSSLQLLTSQKVLCRISFYYDGGNKITEQNFDAFSIYNKYFYIEA